MTKQRSWTNCIAIIGASIVSPRAVAGEGDLFSPHEYLHQQAVKEQKQGHSKNRGLESAEIDEVKQVVVTIDGRPYYKFSRQNQSIFVPKTTGLTDQDLERALCGQSVAMQCLGEQRSRNNKQNPDRLCESQGLEKALLTKAEHRLSEEVAAYAGVIVATIRKSCDRYEVVANQRFHRLFEIGIEVKNKDTRRPGSKKGFIRLHPKRPEVGGGISF